MAKPKVFRVLRLPPPQFSVNGFAGYRTRHYGTHALRVDLGANALTIWTSYGRPIAFAVGGGPRIVCRNVWSRTTGRHLNRIDYGYHLGRLAPALFAQEWRAQVLPLLVQLQRPPARRSRKVPAAPPYNSPGIYDGFY